MNDEGVPNDDMPNFIRPAARDGLPFSDAALAALLAGTEPPEPMPGLQPVADVLAALRSGPTGDELAGEASVLAEFRRSAGVVAHTPARHRPRRVTSLAGARAAVAAAVAALSLGGLATAAYAGILPAPVQRFAHDTIGAPAAPSGSPARTHLPRNRAPVLGVTGPTAHRLCAAYTFAKTHGTDQVVEGCSPLRGGAPGQVRRALRRQGRLAREPRQRRVEWEPRQGFLEWQPWQECFEWEPRQRFLGGQPSQGCLGWQPQQGRLAR